MIGTIAKIRLIYLFCVSLFIQSISRILLFRNDLFFVVFIILFLLNSFVNPITAQEIQFDKITLRDGLPDGTIICMMKDRQGFMWFGTMNGVARYDGYQFKVYQQEKNNPNSLSGRIIFTIIEDREGMLWFGSVEGGLNQFNPRTETFTHYRHNPLDSTSVSHDNIYSLLEDSQGRIWVGSRGGLDVYQPSTKNFRRIRIIDDERIAAVPHQINSLYESPNNPGVIWLGTHRGGIKKLETSTMTTRRFIHDPLNPSNPRSLPHNNIWFIKPVFHSSDNVWIGTSGGGLVMFDTRHELFTQFRNIPGDTTTIHSNEIRTMMYDQSGHLWLGAEGLIHFDPPRVVEKYIHHPGQPASLNSNNVICMMTDENDVHWIGTRNGINRFNSPKEQITFLQSDPHSINSLSGNFIWTLIEDRDGIIWIGIGGAGLDRYDPKTRRFTHYQYRPTDSSALGNNSVRRIYEDRAGTVWIGNIDGILHRFDRRSGKSRTYHIPRRPNNNRDYEIRTMLEDSRGVFWIGTTDGLYTFDRKEWKHTPVRLGPIRSDSLPYLLQINSIVEDSKKRIWIGNEKQGIIRYDLTSGEVRTFLYDSSDITTTGGNSVRNILEDRRGRMWFANGGDGLSMYDPLTDKFTRYSKNDGLPDHAVYGFLEDDIGNLWLITTSTLCRFNPETNMCRNFDERSIGQGGGLNSFAMFKAKDGTMYFGGVNGLNIFHPKNISDNANVPPVFITSVKIFDKEVQTDSASTYRRILELEHDQNSLSFEFAALDYKDQQQNQYAYYLEGLDQSWINSDRRRYVTYTNLRPGSYVFRVKGSNNNGVWNEDGASLSIIIRSPWWTTWWASALYGVLLASVLFGVYRVRNRRLRLEQELTMEHFQKEKFEEMNQMKSRFLANITHELRTPLTMILGPIEAMLGQTHQPHELEQLGYIHRSARKLLQLIEQLLQFSRLEAGSVKLRVANVQVIPLLRRIVGYYTSQSAKKQIELHFSAPEQSINGYIDSEKIEHILQNCLSNAIKYTPAGGIIHVAVEQQQETLVMTIKDNGIGIAPEHLPHVFERFYRVDDTHKTEGVGIGLSLTKELVEIHRGTILIESEVGTGTIVSVRIPLSSYSPHEIVQTPPSDLEVRSTVTPMFPAEEQTDQNHKPLILIAEDNDDARGFIRSQLSAEYTILEAQDGEDAMNITKFQIPDLVISDVMMPKKDGRELCAALKNDERTCHIPVVLLTALAEKEDRMKGLTTGADDYLVKPFDANELLTRVHNLLENRKRMREAYGRTVQLKPGEIAVVSLDDKFLKKAVAIVEAHLSEPEFGVELFAHEIFLSRTQLQRKLKAITNLSPGDFIRHFRMLRAKELLEKNSGSIAEVADAVGFNNHSYFAKCFQEQFGILPNQLRIHQNNTI